MLKRCRQAVLEGDGLMETLLRSWTRSGEHLIVPISSWTYPELYSLFEENRSLHREWKVD